MNKNEKCTCKNTKCSLHGLCKECREKHKNGLPACERPTMILIK